MYAQGLSLCIGKVKMKQMQKFNYLGIAVRDDGKEIQLWLRITKDTFQRMNKI